MRNKHKRRKTVQFYLWGLTDSGGFTQFRAIIGENGKISPVSYSFKSKVTGKQDKLFYKAVKHEGICLFCDEIDFRVLEQHHPYPEKLPKFTVTLCANCHTRLHWMLGGNRGFRK